MKCEDGGDAVPVRLRFYRFGLPELQELVHLDGGAGGVVGEDHLHGRGYPVEVGRGLHLEVPWLSLQAVREGTGLDEDIKAVKLWKDDQQIGQPGYGQWGLTDILVSSGTFDDAICSLDFSTPSTKIQIVPMATVYYFINYDLSGGKKN